MYLPRHFTANDSNIWKQLIADHGFAQIISCFQGKLEINQAPVILSECQSYLQFHLAKANTHWQTLTQAEDLKVCFQGPDAYISPNWYQDPQNVPTWNYLSIQISGKASLLDTEELVLLLDRLSQKHEAKFESPWTLSKLSEKKLVAMTKAIVGIQVNIDQVETKAKLSQNKTPEQLQGLVAGLRTQNSEREHAVADWMENQGG